MTVTTQARTAVEGQVHRGFETVREAFADNFTHRRELGGACCAYHRGEKVVDLWGGVRNKQTGEPWEEDTMVIVYSATKGLAAMTLAIAHSRGWLDYDERVAHYWPEFAQNGKDAVTVRQLLAHQAGLFALDEPIDRSLVADVDRLAVVLARQRPAWEPGTRQAYHAITLGFYQSELLRRIDPRHRTLGQFFQDEIATPLGLDVYIRLPETIPDSRLATVSRPSPVDMLLGFMDNMGLQRVNLAGHGLGGMVAIRAASEHPQRFGKITTVNTPIHGAQAINVRPGALLSRLFGRATPTNVWTKLVKQIDINDAQVKDEIIEDTDSLSETLVERVVASILSTDLRPDLARLELPALAVYCSNDSIVGHSQADLLRELVDGRVGEDPEPGWLPVPGW